LPETDRGQPESAIPHAAGTSSARTKPEDAIAHSNGRKQESVLRTKQLEESNRQMGSERMKPAEE
jgi:hypothetical protein